MELGNSRDQRLADRRCAIARTDLAIRGGVHRASRRSGTQCELRHRRHFLARRGYPGLPSYSLPWVCEHLGIALDEHHDPLADAKACAHILIRLLTEQRVADLVGLSAALAVSMGAYSGSADLRCRVTAAHLGRLLPSPNPQADPAHPFFGRSVTFTGTLDNWTRAEAAALAADRGATVTKGVQSGTAYLVAGVQGPRVLRADGMSAKLRKAIAMGTRVEIITALDFVQML